MEQFLLHVAGFQIFFLHTWYFFLDSGTQTDIYPYSTWIWITFFTITIEFTFARDLHLHLLFQCFWFIYSCFHIKNREVCMFSFIWNTFYQIDHQDYHNFHCIYLKWLKMLGLAMHGWLFKDFMVRDINRAK